MKHALFAIILLIALPSCTYKQSRHDMLQPDRFVYGVNWDMQDNHMDNMGMQLHWELK